VLLIQPGAETFPHNLVIVGDTNLWMFMISLPLESFPGSETPIL